MRKVKVAGLEIRPPSGSAFAYETKPMLPKLHQACLIIGPRGSGKTVAAVNYLEKLPFDRIFVISPTVKSNKEVMSRLKINPDDVHEDPDDISCLDKVKAAIEQERDDLEKYRQDLKRYRRLMQSVDSDRPIASIPDFELAEFFYGGRFEPPKHRYNGRKPVCALFLDDCMGSRLYTQGIRKLNQFTIFHRHIGQLKEGGAIGVTILYALQSYKAQAGGISKCIRNNATSLILFANKNAKQLEEISEECSGEVSPETFMSVYKEAVKEKHDFLFVDLHPKPNHPSGFRRNFNEFIVP